MSAPTTPEVALPQIVALATRAPSIHNTQPWRWRGSGRTLDLYADRARQLTHSDPEGRNLVISCGCMLHHLQVVAQALGWATEVTRFPDPGAPDHLARVELEPAAPDPRAPALLDAVRTRATDRRRFTSWPVPEERLVDLSREAERWQAHAVPVVDAAERLRAEILVHRAQRLAASEPAVAAEQASWVGRDGPDGIPATSLPADPTDVANRYPGGRLADRDGDRTVEPGDGLILFYGRDDAPDTWLRTGEGLSALWLAATEGRLSVVPLSQVVEVPDTGAALGMAVLGGLARPMIAARVGWQAISRSDLPVTPRRPVDDVLDLA